MNEDVEFFNESLWQYNDGQVSKSYLSLDKFKVIDKWGGSPLKLKIAISQFKSKSNNHLYLAHADVFQIIHKLKKFETNLVSNINQINLDNNKVVNYTIKLKKTIVVSVLHRTEYGGSCIRLILSDKNDDYLDSEKIYLPLFDFLSMIKVLVEYRDSFIKISSDASHSILLGKMCEEVHDLNEKASSYYGELMNMFKDRTKLLTQQAKMNNTWTASSEPISPEELPIKELPKQPIESVKDEDDFGLSDISKQLSKPISEQSLDANIIPEEYQDIFGLDDIGKEMEDKKEVVADNVIKDLDVKIDSKIDLKEVLWQNMTEEIKKEPMSESLQSALDSFIITEAPKVDLQLGDDTIESKPIIKPTIDVNIISSGSFTEKILKNDVLNLEMHTINIINDELPFTKFCELIQTKLGFDPLDGVSPEELNGANYLIANYVKYTLQQNLQSSIDFPANVSPIVFESIKSTPEMKSLMYDLIIYFVYYTQLRNMLKDKDYNPMNNRDFMCFCFKNIASPLAISLFKDVDEATIISEITNRLRRYKENGTFNNINTDIKMKHSIEFDLSEESLKVEVSRIYKAITASFDKLTVDYTFKKFNFLNLKLNYDSFKNNLLGCEQIKKIIALEFNIRKNGKIIYDEITYNNFDDIPSGILSKYDIKETKYDSTNLKRLIKEFTKDNETHQNQSLAIAEHINYSYRDLKNIKIDLTPLSVEVLRSIFLWDIGMDNKITINYLHYRELVNNSSLTKDMIISLLTNIQDVVDVDFVNSFIAVRN